MMSIRACVVNLKLKWLMKGKIKSLVEIREIEIKIRESISVEFAIEITDHIQELSNEIKCLKQKIRNAQLALGEDF